MGSEEHLERHDAEEMWRCPQLGGPVPFAYCRVMESARPCPRIVKCWLGRLDIIGWLEGNFTEDELREILEAGSRDRLARILETLKKVREGGR